MTDHTFFDVYLDYGGDELAARGALIKRGFNRIINIGDISIEDQKEFMERHNINYAFLKNGESDNLFIKNHDNEIVDKWIAKIKGAKNANNFLNDTSVLIKSRYGRIKLRKNTQQKIKIAHLATFTNLDCSNFVGSQYYINAKADNSIYNLINAILTSYKTNGTEIDSSKDFKKLIGLSDNREYLTIKFFDEAQAAEFLFAYGDELK